MSDSRTTGHRREVTRDPRALSPHPYALLHFPLGPDADDAELVASVADGVLRPLTVTGDRCFSPPGTVLNGNRRRRAAMAAGLPSVPVRVLDDLAEVDEQRIVLAENLGDQLGRKFTESQRAHLERELAERLGKGQGHRSDLTSAGPSGSADTRDQVAAAVGATRNSVADRRTVFFSPVSPASLRQAVDAGEVSRSRAAAIVRKAERLPEVAAALRSSGSEHQPEVIAAASTWIEQRVHSAAPSAASDAPRAPSVPLSDCPDPPDAFTQPAVPCFHPDIGREKTARQVLHVLAEGPAPSWQIAGRLLISPHRASEIVATLVDNGAVVAVGSSFRTERGTVDRLYRRQAVPRNETGGLNAALVRRVLKTCHDPFRRGKQRDKELSEPLAVHVYSDGSALCTDGLQAVVAASPSIAGTSFTVPNAEVRALLDLLETTDNVSVEQRSHATVARSDDGRTLEWSGRFAGPARLPLVAERLEQTVAALSPSRITEALRALQPAGAPRSFAVVSAMPNTSQISIGLRGRAPVTISAGFTASEGAFQFKVDTERLLRLLDENVVDPILLRVRRHQVAANDEAFFLKTIERYWLDDHARVVAGDSVPADSAPRGSHAVTITRVTTGSAVGDADGTHQGIGASTRSSQPESASAHRSLNAVGDSSVASATSPIVSMKSR